VTPVPAHARRAARAFTTLAWLSLAAAPARVGAQDSSAPRLGLAASGATTFTLGLATVRSADPSPEGGFSLDLGHFHPRLRLVLDLEYLNGHLSRKDSLGNRARGRFYDASAHIGLRWIGRLGELAAPYGAVGLGVHVLGSSTGNPEIDEPYNRNILGIHGAFGFYSPLTQDGRRALSLEVRGVGAQNVRRASIRLAYTMFFRDLVVPVRVPQPQ
jgi:hypothetical protein